MNLIKQYLENTGQVLHPTLNPYGPGVVRIHMIPPGIAKAGVPWVIILNGQYILPVNIKEANRYEGQELKEEELDALVEAAIENVRKVFPKTAKSLLKSDLAEITDTLCGFARGESISANTGFMSLAKYAPYMTAPHRMDLMVSSMSKNAGWNCNQRCLHCYAANQPLGKTKELYTDDWLSIIDKLREACIPQLTFTGGEPTLRSDLVKLISHASWFVTRLNTNGIKLTETLCRELYEASLDSVQITLYSNVPEIHNKLVGVEGFNQTVAGIKNALSAGLNVSINTPLCTLNEDYAATLAFASELGVKYFTCSGLIMTGGALGAESRETRLTNEALFSLLSSASALCEQKHLELSFTSPGWLTEAQLKTLKLTVPSCGACLSNMAVAPDGTVVPCQSWLSGEGLGNLLETSWSRIWNSRQCREIRKVTAKKQQLCQLSEAASLGKGAYC
jgi:radical SAM protein with 4Fe4S-binding SPASM domain